MWLQFLTDEHSPINTTTVFGLLAIVAAFYLLRWLFGKVYGPIRGALQSMLCTLRLFWNAICDSSIFEHLVGNANCKISPLVFYRVTGRVVGLVVAHFACTIFSIDGSSPQFAFGPWDLLGFRILWWGFHFSRIVHFVGLLEDLVLWKSAAAGKTRIPIVGVVQSTVSTFQRFLWDHYLGAKGLPEQDSEDEMWANGGYLEWED